MLLLIQVLVEAGVVVIALVQQVVMAAQVLLLYDIAQYKEKIWHIMQK